MIGTDEAAAILTRVLANLLGTAKMKSGRDGSALRRACGDLAAHAVEQIEDASAVTSLASCFELARQAGANYDGMDRVRRAAQAETPKTLQAVAIAVTAIRFALIQQARMVAAMTFASRNDVERMTARINAAFDPSEMFAADAKDVASYRAILALHAAVSNDLAATARPLPRMVAYSMAQSMPVLWLANRIYGDAARADEIVGENKPVHPAFMPTTGRVLAS